MKRFLSSVMAVKIVLLAASVSFSGTPAPDFTNWKCWAAESKETGTKKLICFDKEPMVVADNMIVRYSPEIYGREGDLLVWFILERSKDVFSIYQGVKTYRIDKYIGNFYKSRRSQDGKLEWIWLENRELTRVSSKESQKVPVVDATSPFGKEYVAFMKRMGRDPAGINMPYIEFYK